MFAVQLSGHSVSPGLLGTKTRSLFSGSHNACRIYSASDSIPVMVIDRTWPIFSDTVASSAWVHSENEGRVAQENRKLILTR